jgi:hypothetical protein
MAGINSKIFAHRGAWNKPEDQNTTEAIKAAFLRGFNVEVDVRLNSEGKLVTGHDRAQIFDWDEIMAFSHNSFIAFHIKEKGLCNKLHELLEKYKYSEYLIFGVEEDEMDLYMSMFGKDKVAYEYFAGGDFEKAFNCRNNIIWLAELDKQMITKKEMIVLKSQGKKLYLVTQDCHAGDMILFGIRLMHLQEGILDGICTDNPAIINKYIT